MAKKVQKMDINDRVRKMTLDNEWLMNVGKSLGFISRDMITELIPNTSDFVSWNADVAKNGIQLVQEVRANNGIRNMFSKQLKMIPQVQILEQGRKNLWEDIKSGKIYNNDRIQGMSTNDDGSFDFSDDDLFGDVNVSFIDDEEEPGSTEEGTSSEGGTRPPVTVINTMPLAKTMQASTEATIGTMNAIADQQMAIESEKIMLTQQSTNSLLNGLSSINDNLALLVQFNSDSTSKYHAAAMKYYEQSLEMMEKIKTSEEKTNRVDRLKNFIDPFTSTGGLKLDEYMNIIKQNLTDIKDENVMISQVADFVMDKDMLSTAISNPGVFIPQMLMGLVPKVVKSTMKSFDENLSAIMPAILAKISSWEDNDNPFLNSINKIFGYNVKVKRNIDLGDYEKGKVEWDGESKKALVEVIPAYLRRIESALTGEEERIFNYDKGIFVDKRTLQKQFDEKVRDADTSGYTMLKSSMREIARKMDLSAKDMEQFEEDMTEYLQTMTKKGHMIKFRDYKDVDGLVQDDFANYGLFGGDPDRQEFMKLLLERVPQSVITEAFTVGIMDSVKNSQREHDEMQRNTNLSGYSALNHEKDENGKIKYFKPGGVKDVYGLSELDYLRDIRSALIHGIRVFPDNRKKFKGSGINPNGDLINKEANEISLRKQKELDEEEKKKQKEELKYGDNKGNTIEKLAQSDRYTWDNYLRNDDDDIDFDESTKTGKLMRKIQNISDKMGIKVSEILLGDEDYVQQLLDKVNKKFGKDDKSAIENIKDMFSDTSKAIMSYFTGQPYVTADGIHVSGNKDAIFGKVKNFFTGSIEKLKGKDGESGVIGKFATDIAEGFNKFKVSLFGEKALSEKDSKETSESLMKKIKERLPKAIAYGYGGAVVKTYAASNLGILGNFLLPGGPLASALMGITFGFLRQSETFNKFMFGEKDADGNRLGGLISKEWQDAYKEHAPAIKKGAGLGLLASLFLPGAPALHAITGIGISMASKNEAFQEFLFGKDFKTDEKKSLMNGVFGKVFKRMSGGEGDPQLTKFMGAAGLGIGVAQGVGLLPSFLLPGGPVMGAILGLAGGITASSNKFQELLLGEKDVDGKRYGGLLHRVTNWLDIKFMQPLKIKATEISDGIYGFLRKKLFDPIARSFEPIVYAAKNMFIDIKDKVVDAFTSVTSPIVEAFKDYVVKPLGGILKKTLINPLKKLLGGTFKLLGKTLLNVVSLPLLGIGAAGTLAERYNKKSVIRQEKRRREKEYYKEHKDDNKWSRYYGSKMARHMTKEEEQQIINEKLPYMDGKTRRQRKKEQKADYKDEMLKRKERLDAMKQQYEEDKKFAEKNNFKFKSKKQQEMREQELKEKDIWFQEQQLLKAQDTDEKVTKIADNIIEFPKQTDRVVNKLNDVQETLKEGFNKLMGKKSTDESPNNVIPFHKGGNYGKVTDDDLNKIHEYLGEPKLEPKKYDPNRGNLIPFYKGGNYGKVTDDDLNKIHNFIDTENQKEEEAKKKPKLKDARDGFFKNGKIIDITKKLRDDDHSHKDGLDKVPEDGYIAELHEGEMVVPKKPAGKLRKMMNKAGKGFKGLTNVLAEVSEDDRRDRGDNALGLSDDEADRMKELEDRQRRQSLVEKGKDIGTKAALYGIKGATNLVGKGVTGAVNLAGKGVAGTARGLANVSGLIANGADNVVGFLNGERHKKSEEEKTTLAEKLTSIGANVSGKIDEFGDNVVDKANEFNHDILENGPMSAFKKMFGFGRNDENKAAEKREIEDDALGLTEDQEDRLKELEDIERKEKVSRKGVDFVQEKIAAEEKEKADRAWKNKLLAAIGNIGSIAASGVQSGLNLFDMLKSGISNILGGGGNLASLLKSLALPVGVGALIKKWSDYKNSEEYIEGRTDVDGTMVYDNTDHVIAKNIISARNPLFLKPVKAIKKAFVDPTVKAGKAVYNTGKKVFNGGKNLYNKIFNKKTATKTTSNVIDFASAKAAKEAGESVAGKTAKEAGEKTLSKVVNLPNTKLNKVLSTEAVEAAGKKGLITKLIDLAKQAVKWIGEKAMEKFPKKGNIASKLLGCADEVFGAFLKGADNILVKFGKKITAFFAKLGLGTGTMGIVDAVFLVADLGTGLTAGNAGNLFGVDPENVDARMRIISSILQAVTNCNFLAVISLVNEICDAIWNFNFLRKLAIWLYNITGGKQDLSSRITAKQIDSCKSIEEALSIMGITSAEEIAMLKDGDTWKDFSSVDNKELGGVLTPTEQMELARLQYNLENGTKLSSQAWMDKESKTVGSKIWDWTKKLFTSESSETKLYNLQNKVTDKTAKAESYREKAKNSKNVFTKAWNNSMAWLNEKSAKRAEAKIEKTKTKSAEKKAKAESKVAKYEEKLANSTNWFSKKWNSWRLNANKKKVTKYTINGEDQLVQDNTSTSTGTSVEGTETESMSTGYISQAMSPEEVLMQYDIPEGEYIQDGYGNIYDHTGNVVNMSGDAGTGDGEPVVDINGNIVTTDKSAKKNGFWKSLGNAALNTLFPHAAVVKAGFGIYNNFKSKSKSKLSGDAGMGDGVDYTTALYGKNEDPEDYKLLPIMNENGDVVSYKPYLIEETTEVEGLQTKEATTVITKNVKKKTEVIPQVDEKGNIISYTTVEKNKKTSLLSKITSGIGSLFGRGSSSVDNSSTVTNNTGDTYNTTNTTEIDSSPLNSLTEAINKLTQPYGNENVDEEGNIKTGGILNIIMDPMGYLTKKLVNYGINVYEDNTGKDVDDEKINKGVSLFNMIRNPFGYLYSVINSKTDSNDDGQKDKSFWDATKEATNEAVDWANDKWTKTKKNVNEGWDKTKDWTKDKWDSGKKWVDDKWGKVEDFNNKQRRLSDDAADIMFGNNKADTLVTSGLSTGLSLTSQLTTKIWNSFAGEDMQLGETDVQDFLATILHDAFIAPFQEKTDAFLEKKEEIQNEIGNWVKGIKDNVVEGWNKYISEPFKNYMEKEKAKFEERKKKQEEWINKAKDNISEGWNKYVKEPFKKYADKEKAKFEERKKKQEEWIGNAKDNIVDAWNKFIKEPFSNWVKKNDPKIKEMYNGAKEWITGIKDGIVGAFNKYIKDPVSGAWDSLKSAFAPFLDVFTKIMDGDFKGAFNKMKEVGAKGREESNADDDNDQFSSGTTKPLSQQLKPKNYVFSETDNTYEDPKKGTNFGGLKDRGNTHNFPFYAQADTRWGNEKLMGSKTLGDVGCGPTSTAMVMTHITGQHITPDTMAKAGEGILPGYTSYNYFPTIAEKFKLNYSEANDVQAIRAKLLAGEPVILAGTDKSSNNVTPYTKEGHIVVATGIDGNNIQINDPRGPAYSGSYSINNVMNGLKRGIVLSSTKATKSVGLPSSGVYDVKTVMDKQLEINEDLPTVEGITENLGGDAGQIKLWEKVVGYAKAFKEKLKYSYGSTAINKNGMTTDCSAFTQHVMNRAAGVSIPRSSSEQKKAGTGVSTSEAQAGDLVVWSGHAGLVIDSNGNMIDAGSGSVPKIRAWNSGYWAKRGTPSIRRVLSNPNQMVSAKVNNYHTGIGFSGIVGSQGGGNVSGGSDSTGTADGTTEGATATAEIPQIDELGPFAEFERIAKNMVASIYNGKEVDLFATPTVTSDTTTTTGGTTGGSTDISGISDTATAVWKFFTGMGYSPHATAGIMGNLKQESSLDPTRKQSGGGPGRGIAQWTVNSGRFKGLQSHAKSKGKDWTDLQSQLEWIDMELGGKDSTTASILNKRYGGLSGLKKATDYKWAVEAFEKSFERAGKPNYNNRYKYAGEFYNSLASAGSGDSSMTKEELMNSAGGGFNMATNAESYSGSGIPTTLNGWAYYQQTDPQWQENINGRKIGPSGCGMTSHAMMLTTMFGKRVTPVTVGKWARANGHWPSGMSWSMPPAVASKLGLKITKSETRDGGLGASSLANLKAQIKAGHPAILSGQGRSNDTSTPFTNGGHIVLAVGVDGSGNLIINDPRGTKYTKSYADDNVLNIGKGLRGYWAFDKPSSASLPEDWASGEYSGGNASNGATGGATGEGATATAEIPQIDELGPFAEFERIAKNMVASIYNGKEVDLFATPTVTSDTTTGDTTGGGAPTGDSSYNGTKYDLSSYSMDGLSDKQKSHINKMIHGTLHTYKTHGLFPSLTIAQSAQESGWGLTSGLATKGNAAFGIKADKSWTGKVYNGKTFEYGANGKYNTTAGFRAYNSIDESIIDRANFLKKNSRYTKAGVFSASTPAEQARALQKAGYATDPNYASTLNKIISSAKLTRFDTPKPPKEASSAGKGDGNTYLVSPKGDAGKGEKVSYNKSITNNTGTNSTNIAAQRELENINRKINVAVNNINASDPNAYAEILKLIMQELQAINNNTAATATGVKNIEVVSANTSVSNTIQKETTADMYTTGSAKQSLLRQVNNNTGYASARQMAGYNIK